MADRIVITEANLVEAIILSGERRKRVKKERKLLLIKQKECIHNWKPGPLWGKFSPEAARYIYPVMCSKCGDIDRMTEEEVESLVEMGIVKKTHQEPQHGR